MSNEKDDGVFLQPLSGRCILVTRARDQASVLAALIQELGGEAVEFPVIQIQPPTNEASVKQLDDAIERICDFDWIVFTSTNGVHFFMQRLLQNKGTTDQMGGAKIVAVGPKTDEALLANGIKTDIVASKYQQEGVLEAMLPHLKAGESILLPISNIARDFLPLKLREHGMQVTVVDAYENVPGTEFGEQVVELLMMGKIHIITFTSSSTVTYLFAALRKLGIEQPLALLRQAEIACIGPLTARTAEEAGLQVDYLAKEATVVSLVDAIVGDKATC